VDLRRAAREPVAADLPRFPGAGRPGLGGTTGICCARRWVPPACRALGRDAPVGLTTSSSYTSILSSSALGTTAECRASPAEANRRLPPAASVAAMEGPGVGNGGPATASLSQLPESISRHLTPTTPVGRPCRVPCVTRKTMSDAEDGLSAATPSIDSAAFWSAVLTMCLAVTGACILPVRPTGSLWMLSGLPLGQCVWHREAGWLSPPAPASTNPNPRKRSPKLPTPSPPRTRSFRTRWRARPSSSSSACS